MSKKEVKAVDVLNLQSKEVRYLVAYMITNSKTDAYKFIQEPSAQSTEASIRAMASAYSKKPAVEQLEPVIRKMFIQAATKLLNQDGYTILNPKQSTEYAVMKLTNETKSVKTETSSKAETKHCAINPEANTEKGGNETNNNIDRTETSSESQERTEANRTEKVYDKGKDGDVNYRENRNGEEGKDGEDRKDGEGIDSEPAPQLFLPDSDLPDLDLSNKDDLLKELQIRYKGERDPKVKNEIAKMIIDVQQMKKQDIVEQGKVQKVMYLPLRKCEHCPELHATLLRQIE